MLIDWTTVIAQVVNFLILLILLKFLLYDRIIRAMDQREERIQSRLEDAERKRQEAEQELAEFEEKKLELEQKREEFLNDAKKEAESYKNTLIQEIRREIDSLEKRWRRSIEQEKESFARELRMMTARQVYDICRRAMSELSDTNIQDRTVEVFLERFQGMEDSKKQDLLSEDGGMVLKSSFDLTRDKRENIENALKETLETLPEISYETEPGLILGIEIKRRDKKVAWSLENYLSELENMTLSAFEREIKKHKQDETDTDTSRHDESNHESDSESTDPKMKSEIT